MPATAVAVAVIAGHLLPALLLVCSATATPIRAVRPECMGPSAPPARRRAPRSGTPAPPAWGLLSCPDLPILGVRIQGRRGAGGRAGAHWSPGNGSCAGGAYFRSATNVPHRGRVTSNPSSVSTLTARCTVARDT